MVTPEESGKKILDMIFFFLKLLVGAWVLCHFSLLLVYFLWGFFL